MLPVARLVPPAESAAAIPVAGRLTLDGGRLDAALGGGLALAGSHEIYGPASMALALMLMLASPRKGPILWICSGRSDDGRLNGDGIAELGGDPARLWLVSAGGVLPMLRAAAEAQRCGALAGVVLDSGTDAPAIDLTVTRRLQLAAAASGVFTLLLRRGSPRPSAALTRWQAAPAVSRRLAAGAPGSPRLAITLARQRGGPADIAATLEWNRDRCRFFGADRGVGAAIPIGAAFGGHAAHFGRVPAVPVGRASHRAAPRAA